MRTALPLGLAVLALAACEANVNSVTQIGDGQFFVSTENNPDPDVIVRSIRTPSAVWDITGLNGRYLVKYTTAETTQADVDAVLPSLCEASGRQLISASHRPLSGLNAGSTGVDVVCGAVTT